MSTQNRPSGPNYISRYFNHTCGTSQFNELL
uniref:Uncharacterized protein n=1 Tax=Tetranychus urticae TaxID=32264 RepID=T1K597_TETUR